jgi:hypothetical protein
MQEQLNKNGIIEALSKRKECRIEIKQKLSQEIEELKRGIEEAKKENSIINIADKSFRDLSLEDKMRLIESKEKQLELIEKKEQKLAESSTKNTLSPEDIEDTNKPVKIAIAKYEVNIDNQAEQKKQKELDEAKLKSIKSQAKLNELLGKEPQTPTEEVQTELAPQISNNENDPKVTPASEEILPVTANEGAKDFKLENIPQEILNTTVGTLVELRDLDSRTGNTLIKNKIQTIANIIEKKEYILAVERQSFGVKFGLPGLGTAGLDQIKLALLKRGIVLKRDKYKEPEQIKNPENSQELIEILGLTTKINNFLKKEGIKTIADLYKNKSLIALSAQKLGNKNLGISKLGKDGVTLIVKALREYGINWNIAGIELGEKTVEVAGLTKEQLRKPIEDLNLPADDHVRRFLLVNQIKIVDHLTPYFSGKNPAGKDLKPLALETMPALGDIYAEALYKSLSEDPLVGKFFSKK